MPKMSNDTYNTARSILTLAGSRTAGTSHPKHASSAPATVAHGQELLRGARDEFRASDKGKPSLVAGMTADHHKAVTKAADEMGITTW